MHPLSINLLNSLNSLQKLICSSLEFEDSFVEAEINTNISHIYILDQIPEDILLQTLTKCSKIFVNLESIVLQGNYSQYEAMTREHFVKSHIVKYEKFCSFKYLGRYNDHDPLQMQ